MEKPNRLPTDTINPPEFMPAASSSLIGLLAEMVADIKETYNPLDPEWLKQAECNTAGVASSDFFGTGADHQLAKEACGRCGIALPCLKYALDNNEKEGIWGGTDMRDRRVIRAKLTQRRSNST